MIFDSQDFWIQIHDLPLGCSNINFGQIIGQRIGKVVEVDKRWGRFLRVRITVNILEPLMRGLTLNLQGKDMWVSFKYERLPSFCHGCGLIDHKVAECTSLFEPGLYGGWLRAGDGFQNKGVTTSSVSVAEEGNTIKAFKGKEVCPSDNFQNSNLNCENMFDRSRVAGDDKVERIEPSQRIENVRGATQEEICGKMATLEDTCVLSGSELSEVEKRLTQEKEFMAKFDNSGGLVGQKRPLSQSGPEVSQISNNDFITYRSRKRNLKTAARQKISIGEAEGLEEGEISMDVKSIASKLSSSGMLRTQGLIGGKWLDSYDGKTIKVNNPATGEIIAEVACMGKRETDDAIASAHLTYNSWSKLTAQERSKYLRKWYDLLMEHKEELGQLITLEQGKPLKEAVGEVGYGASFIEFYAEEAKRIYGDVIPATLSDRRLVVLKQPVGVVGAITPWNFPLAMITRKVGPALACGCTVVIKPAELTPLTALAAADLAHQAGIPPGAINVVMGNAPEIGDALLASSQVRKITFTGSTAVGKKLMAGAAQTVKKVSLELGGNAPCIVFDDADIDVAVKGTLAAKFRNSGQTCVCANRVLVQEGIYPKFVEAFTKAVQSLQVGDGFGEGVTQFLKNYVKFFLIIFYSQSFICVVSEQGPLINEAAVQKVESFLEDAVSKVVDRWFLGDGSSSSNLSSIVDFHMKGANVLLGGKRHSLGLTFFEPTVLGDVNKDMLVSRQEVFGPVAPLLPFKTEEDAIFLANDTNAGLAAYIFTNNVQRSWRVSEALEYGLVGVNEGIISTEVAPFGGVKESGLGREGSKYGMDEYLEVKYVCFGDMNRK
ncbi:hypothetical protein ACFE04_022823 [Oxalis oulophora]